MNDYEVMKHWLENKLRRLSSSINDAFIFGSVASQIKSPSDCDLFIVTNLEAGSEQWFGFRNWLTQIGLDFKETFNLPLSIVLMTTREFSEESDFLKNIRNHPTLKLELRDHL